MMTLSSVAALLHTALMLLSLVNANPSLPRSTRDYASQVAQQVIAQATEVLAAYNVQGGGDVLTPISPSTQASCAFGGQAIANSQSVIAYQSSSVSYGQLCVSEQRTCVNGTLSGSYELASCAIQASLYAACSWNGQSISNGQSVTAYQSSLVAYGQQCMSETRSCNNGTLSGSFGNASCAVSAPPISATASGVYQSKDAANSVDTDESTIWNSGGYAPQWIEFDLGAAQTLSKLSLGVIQTPAGYASHTIYAGASPGPTTAVATLSGYFGTGDVVGQTFGTPLQNIRYVRVVTNSSPSWVAWGSVRFNDAAATPSYQVLKNPHIQQFAYYYTADSSIDYISDVAPYSDTVMIVGNTPTDFAPRVQEAAQYGLGVVLGVEHLFFSSPGHMRSDAQSQFDALLTSLAAYRSSIKGFYLADEPYGYNVNSGVSDSRLKADLESEAGYIHAKMPGLPTMIIFSYPEIRRSDFYSSLLPSSVDWIGFDCYLAFGSACSDANVQNDFQTMAAHKYAGQKILLVPDAYWASQPSASTDAQVAARVAVYESFAQNQDVVAIYPFIYENIPGQNIWGAQSLPVTFSALKLWFSGLR